MSRLFELNVRRSYSCSGRGRGVWSAFAWTVRRATRPSALMAAGGMVGGLLVALIGHVGRGNITMPPLLFLATLFAIGIASAGLFVPYRTVLQRETPPNLLGRVTAVGEAAIAIATLVGPPLGAILANMAGISAPFLLGGYLIALLALALVFSRRRISAPRKFRKSRKFRIDAARRVV